jgi:hypothetical protein
VLSRKKDEKIIIGDNIVIEVLSIRDAPIGDDERQAVIDACHAIVADGLYPSVARLRHRFPGQAGQRLAAIRDAAIEAGLVVPGPVGGIGLNGRTDKELEEVEDRTEAIRKEKVARGEVPRPVELRVVHDRRPTSRRTIGGN